MNVPQKDLDNLAGLALHLRTRVQQAARLHGRQQFDALLEVDTLFAGLVVSLLDVGARDPYTNGNGRGNGGSAADVPLALLNTPANRRYADALRVAYDAALAVDRERYGPSIGTDGCGQALELLLRDVENELHGAPSPHE